MPEGSPTPAHPSNDSEPDRAGETTSPDERQHPGSPLERRPAPGVRNASGSPGRPWWLSPISLVVLAVVAAGAGYAGWRATHKPADQQAGAGQPGAGGQGGGGKPADKPPVTVSKTMKGDFPVYLTGLGTVQAFNTVTVVPQTSGQIESIDFQEGQIVRRGDLIARIDPRPLQAALAQAQAKLAQDQATLSDANTNLQRYGQLAQQNFASRQQLDAQATAVNQGKALVEGDQASIANAQTQLGYATIRAPISGRVGFRLVDVGNVVSPSTAGIVTIQQIQPISVVFTAPEDELTAIAKALNAGKPPVRALSSDGQRTLADGFLALVNNEVDSASGTVRLKAIFGNETGALWPGLSVSTRLLVQSLKDAAIVPADAVQHGPDGLFAYVVGPDSKAAMRKIEVSQNDGSQAVVTKGLEPGDSVVVEGQYRVEPGHEVDAKDIGADRPAGDGKAGGDPGRAQARADAAKPTAQE